MKISTKALHYRWISYLTKELTSEQKVPANLCSYFWHFLALNIWALIVQTGVFIALFFILAPVLYMFSLVDGGTAFGMGLVELALFVLFLISYSYDKGGFAAVIINYFKAVKGKYCPQIEFTE